MNTPRPRRGWAGRLLLIAALAGFGLWLPGSGGSHDELRLEGVGNSSAAPAAKEKKPKKPKEFEIAGAMAGLYPGSSRSLVLTVTNPFKFAIEVTSLTVTVDGSDRAGCDASNLLVEGFSGSMIIPQGESRQQPVLVRMAPDARDACRAAIFGLTYGGGATRA